MDLLCHHTTSTPTFGAQKPYKFLASFCRAVCGQSETSSPVAPPSDHQTEADNKLTLLLREKGRDLTQSYDKSPYTHRKPQ